MRINMNKTSSVVLSHNNVNITQATKLNVFGFNV